MLEMKTTRWKRQKTNGVMDAYNKGKGEDAMKDKPTNVRTKCQCSMLLR